MVVAAALAVAVFLVFLPVRENGFVLYDDDLYLTENTIVARGLSRDGVVWAFTTLHGGNWHPLTWVSHMLDVTLFGMDAGRHHLVSAGIHAFTAALLFLVVNAATGTIGPPLFVAALFAVHPLHVESVVWAAERKDVLVGLFWMLTMLAYLRHVRRPGIGRFVPVVGCCVCALLAKPAAVALPAALLVLDYWPLGRLARRGPRWRPIVEKLPLFALACACAAITYVAQESEGALLLSQTSPLLVRAANAATATVWYLRKTLWPTALAHYYPHPMGGIAWGHAAAALVAIVLASAAAWLLRKRRPAVVSGWAWYLVTLAPAIGIVQAGSQAMADRYTYLPLIGVFLAVAWEGRTLATLRPARTLAIAAALAVVAVLVPVTRRQIGLWRDTIVLSRNALAVTRDNWFVQNNLGLALSAAGRNAEAMAHFREALRVRPDDVRALNNMGVALFRQGRCAEAASWFSRAARIDPANDDVRRNLAVARSRLAPSP